MIDSSQPRGALSVNGVDWRSVGDTSMQGRHSGGRRSSTGGKDISDGNVLDQGRVEVDLLVDCAEDTREDFLWPGILEATLLCFCDGRANGGDDNDVVVVLGENDALCVLEFVGDGLGGFSVGRHGGGGLRERAG